MSSKTTVRATLSTCVRAVAKITPKAWSFAPCDLDRQRGAEVDPVVVPLVDLRLVDEHLPVGKVDDARPRVGRELRCGGGGRSSRGGRLLGRAAGACCADAAALATSMKAKTDANAVR